MGVCASGKTTISRLLIDAGYNCRHIAQEHSYVADMWQRLTHPDVLVFLKVSYSNTIKRRNLNWTEAEYQEQIYRLRHAIDHADLIVDTDRLNVTQVVEKILSFINKNRMD